MIRYYVTFICVFSTLFLHAQVGINTLDPQAMLDIRSQGKTSATNGLTIKNDSGDILFGVQDDGRILTKGVEDPSVLLDLST